MATEVSHNDTTTKMEFDVSDRVFCAGNVLTGRVKLETANAIDVEEFEVALLGQETISYLHKKKPRELTKILLTATDSPTLVERSINPGEFTHEFKFELPEDLPSTHTLSRDKLGSLTKVTSSVVYTVNAKLKPRGRDAITSRHTLRIRSRADDADKESSKCVSESTTKRLSLVSVFGGDKCRITGASITKVVDLIHGVIRVHASVRNDSPKVVQHVKIRVFENVEVKVNSTDLKVSAVDTRCIHEEGFDGIAPWGSRGDYVLEMRMKDLHAGVLQLGKKKVKETESTDIDFETKSDTPTVLTLLPTTDTNFLSVTYHIAISCSYGWRSKVELKLPLIFGAPVAEVAVVLPMPALLEDNDNPVKPAKEIDEGAVDPSAVEVQEAENPASEDEHDDAEPAANDGDGVYDDDE